MGSDSEKKKHKLMFSRAHKNSLRFKKFLVVCCDALLLYVFIFLYAFHFQEKVKFEHKLNSFFIP